MATNSKNIRRPVQARGKEKRDRIIKAARQLLMPMAWKR